jgi:hypothetical protein
MAKGERNESDFTEIPLPLGDDELIVERLQTGEVSEEELREWLDTLPFSEGEKQTILETFKNKED